MTSGTADAACARGPTIRRGAGRASFGASTPPAQGDHAAIAARTQRVSRDSATFVTSRPATRRPASATSLPTTRHKRHVRWSAAPPEARTLPARHRKRLGSVERPAEWRAHRREPAPDPRHNQAGPRMCKCAHHAPRTDHPQPHADLTSGSTVWSRRYCPGSAPQKAMALGRRIHSRPHALRSDREGRAHQRSWWAVWDGKTLHEGKKPPFDAAHRTRHAHRGDDRPHVHEEDPAADHRHRARHDPSTHPACSTNQAAATHDARSGSGRPARA